MGLQPHCVRQFKLSKDLCSSASYATSSGSGVDLPAHAVVLSVDEKSHIWALDRTYPGLPMKMGRAAGNP
jgi:hypothetical protein